LVVSLLAAHLPKLAGEYLVLVFKTFRAKPRVVAPNLSEGPEE